MSKNRDTVKQYLRWLGGKYKVIKTLMDHMPAHNINYFAEPFCGSAIVYVNMHFAGLVSHGLLNDIGKWAVMSHKLIRDDLPYYLKKAKKYQKAVEATKGDASAFKELYLKIREEFNANIETVDNAQIMRFIFLSKMGFNGLIRFNKQGLSTTAPGVPKLKYSIDEDNLALFSIALKDARFSIFDFAVMIEKIQEHFREDDMVFWDPPYLPTDFDGSDLEKPFGNYFGTDFNWHSLEKIKEYFDYFSKKKVSQMLTINDFPQVRDLFKDYIICEHEVIKIRKGTAGFPGKTKELIITNYERKRKDARK